MPDQLEALPAMAGFFYAQIWLESIKPSPNQQQQPLATHTVKNKNNKKQKNYLQIVKQCSTLIA